MKRRNVSSDLNDGVEIAVTQGGKLVSKQKITLSPVVMFQSGDKVRVKHGIMDTDYPDMPLGGWAGTIAKIHDNGMYTVRWSRETLAAIHPVFKKRCEKDGLVLEQYFLSADDLEHDAGGPLNIEQPTAIITKPLSPKDQDDRIRMVFELTSNDPLPVVDKATLEVYHQYLAKNLVLPFSVEHAVKYGNQERVTVIGLGDSCVEPMFDEMYGVFCEARRNGQVVPIPLGLLKNVKDKSNRKLINDLSYWFNNGR